MKEINPSGGLCSSFFFYYYGFDHFECLVQLEHLEYFYHMSTYVAYFKHHLIIVSSVSPSDNLISLSYLMPAFSLNSFGIFSCAFV